MTYEYSSDTHLVTAYGPDSLWIYDVATTNGAELLQVSTQSGAVVDVVPCQGCIGPYSQQTMAVSGWPTPSRGLRGQHSPTSQPGLLPPPRSSPIPDWQSAGSPLTGQTHGLERGPVGTAGTRWSRSTLMVPVGRSTPPPVPDSRHSGSSETPPTAFGRSSGHHRLRRVQAVRKRSLLSTLILGPSPSLRPRLPLCIPMECPAMDWCRGRGSTLTVRFTSSNLRSTKTATSGTPQSFESPFLLEIVGTTRPVVGVDGRGRQISAAVGARAGLHGDRHRGYAHSFGRTLTVRRVVPQRATKWHSRRSCRPECSSLLVLRPPERRTPGYLDSQSVQWKGRTGRRSWALPEGP